MNTLDLEINVSVDGNDVAGFPYRRHLILSQVLHFTNSITQTATYTNVLTNYVPTSAVIPVVFFITTNTACTLSINDSAGATPDQPISLSAGQVLLVVGNRNTSTSALPLFRVKAATNPTLITVVVGFR